MLSFARTNNFSNKIDRSDYFFLLYILQLTLSISHLFSIFMANTWFVDVIRTTHTSPNAPRPITLSTSKSSRLSRKFLINWTTGFTNSIKSLTVFSRRSDELQHSSYNTINASNSASTDNVLPGLMSDELVHLPSNEANKMLDAPFSIIIDSNWRKRFKPETGAMRKKEENNNFCFVQLSLNTSNFLKTYQAFLLLYFRFLHQTYWTEVFEHIFCYGFCTTNAPEIQIVNLNLFLT